MTGIIDLTLNKNQINKIDPITFKDLSNLPQLDLTSNKITELYANNFEGLISLQTLLLCN